MGSLLTGTNKEGYTAVEEGASIQTLQNLIDTQQPLLITGHRADPFRTFLYRAIIVLFAGLPWLFVRWYPKLNKALYPRESLKDADFILVKDSVDGYSFYRVEREELNLEGISSSILKHARDIRSDLRFFFHHHVKYVWDSTQGGFEPLRGWDNGEKTVRQLIKGSKGLTANQEALLLKYYGDNDIPVEILSVWRLLVQEVVHPFYLFQLCSVVLWCLDEYHAYAICVLIITAGSVTFALRSKHQQQVSLSEYVERSRVDRALVMRPDGTSELVPAARLVPGDVIEIPKQGCILACDALLINGHCVVNESTLTGESSSVTKTPPAISDDRFDSFLFKRNTLYAGTKVLQIRCYDSNKVRAVVVNTGFCTAKGELIRSILIPKPIIFKFYQDSAHFVMALFGVAAIGIVYLATVHALRDVDWDTSVINCLDLITIVVPPALPAAMTAGVVYAQSRLRTRSIFCTSSATINIAGKLKLFCFDKTGTLTEDGVDLWAAMPVDMKRHRLHNQYPSLMDHRDHFVVAMATCHSLTRIEGKLSGGPLELSIFNAVNWELVEQDNVESGYENLCPLIVRPRLRYSDQMQQQKDFAKAHGRTRTVSAPAYEGEKIGKPRSGSLSPLPLPGVLNADTVFHQKLPYEVGIVRQFPFNSASQSMTVITRCLGADHMVLYTKGAPEKILHMCLATSIPKSVKDDLKTLTSSGYRVIALAYRDFERKFNWRKMQKARREDVEVDLTFLGLLVLKNNLKPNASSVIRELSDASVRCVMVTGDNLLTAVSVSRECGMVPVGDSVVEVIVEMPADGAPFLSFHPMGVVDSGVLSPTNRHWHYAMDGHNFALLRMHLPELVDGIVVRATVFARMLPEQKSLLIQVFQDLNYVVGMCGDGANDCGALKVAHIGISLSETESSIAAPFTCANRDLSCVPYLLKEGRCALVTSFVIFKYMTMYSLVQFFSVVILHSKGIALSTVEFLYVDLVITTSMAVVIGRTGPTPTLHNTRPLAKLFSASNLVPLALQLTLVVGCLYSALFFLQSQLWFSPVEISNEEEEGSWENTVIYCVSCFQYLILGLVYSKGKPHCRPFFTDFWFMLIWTLLFCLTTMLCARPPALLAEWFDLVPSETDTPEQAKFRVLLLLFPFTCFFISFVIESSVAQRKWLKAVLHFVLGKKKPKNLYKRVLTENVLWRPDVHADSNC